MDYSHSDYSKRMEIEESRAWYRVVEVLNARIEAQNGYGATLELDEKGILHSNWRNNSNALVVGRDFVSWLRLTNFFVGVANT